MRALKKTIVLLLLTATAVAGGCGGGYYSDGYDQVPTQKVIVEHRDQDSWSDIMAMTQRQQMINMEQQKQMMEGWDNTMDRMKGTMGKFGRSLDEANRMRRRNRR